MRITASAVKHTPVLLAPPGQPHAFWLQRAWGAVARKDDTWVMPGYYPFGLDAVSDLEKLFPGALELDAGAQARVRELRAADALWRGAQAQYDAKKPVDLPLPAGFRFHLEPFAHQRLGLAKALAFWRLFVFWEMGTGKTKLFVDLCRVLRAQGGFVRSLVVCPTVVCETWRREVDKHSKGELSAYVWDGDSDPAEAAEHAFVVLTYARARILEEQALKAKAPHPFDALDYDTMAIDEGHSIGNWESAQTRAVLRLSAKAARRYDLTGTAADNPLKLYPQFEFLSPSIVKQSYQDFFAAHAVTSRNNKHVVIGYRHLDKINAQVDRLATRMKKKECLDLPPMTVVDVPFRLGTRQRARYNELVAEMRASHKPVVEYASLRSADEALELDPRADPATLFNLPHGAARVNKLLQLTSGFLIVGPDTSVCDACPYMAECVRGGVKPYTARCKFFPDPVPRKVVRDVENPKREVFKTMLESVLEEDPTNKVLAWATYLPELDDLAAVCDELGVGYVRVDGSNTKDIGRHEDAFQKDPACRVYIGQVASGVGITLTAANYTFYYSLPWNPVHYRQSLDRNNRPGQTRKMTVYRLVGEKTLDESVAAILRYKDTIAFTMLEKVACASCHQGLLCATQDPPVRPFRRLCIYSSDSNRPIATPEIV